VLFRSRPVSSNEWRIIAGVVEDVRNFSMSGPPGWVDGEIYFPLAQAMYAPRTISLIARLDGDTSSFEKRLPGMIQAVCASCAVRDRKSTRLNSSHGSISYAVFCLKKKKNKSKRRPQKENLKTKETL